MTEVSVRIMLQADKPAVADLTTRAFGRPEEANIIRKLEDGGEVLVQYVAEMDGQIVGHILFYPMGVFGRLGGAGLGPMCVDPWVHREGIGSRLVRTGLEMMKQSGVPIVFVLGHESYYPRFGFSCEAAAAFDTPVRGPGLMALRLRHGPPMSGRLIFPDAFGIPLAPV